MPAKAILSNQWYRPGETPVYIAYILRNGMPITRNDVYFAGVRDEDPNSPTFDEPLGETPEVITMTHMERRDGVRNGVIVNDWFPVRYQGGTLEDIPISRACIFDTPLEITADVLAHIHNRDEFEASFSDGLYNFIYIPLNGHRYYPKYNSDPDEGYRTVFKIQLLKPVLDDTTGEQINAEKDTMDIVTFQSFSAVHINRTGGPILTREPTEEVPYGEDILLVGHLYSKYKEPEQSLQENPDDPDGDYVLLTNPDRGKVILKEPIREQIEEVYLTVFHVQTSQRIIDRIRIVDQISWEDTVIPFLAGTESFDHNFVYKFATNQLSIAGMYRFRFEVEANRDLINEAENNILCVFDVDVMVV
jgi:hypothetical protein